jgi:hypothetical protein
MLAVRVTATAFLDPQTEEVRLTWLLEPAEGGQPWTQSTADAGLSDDSALLDLCYELSAAVNRQATVPELCQLIGRMSAELASADAAAVALMQGPKELTVEATSEAAREAAVSQFAVREGPTFETMTHAESRGYDAQGAESWPAHGAYLSGLGLRHELAMPLHCRNVRATVTVFSSSDAPFSEPVRERLALLTRHAGTVLAQADVEANLRVAVHSRQQVGQAVGILIERHRITPRAAFDRLVRSSNMTQTKLRDLATMLIETGEEPQGS